MLETGRTDFIFSFSFISFMLVNFKSFNLRCLAVSIQQNENKSKQIVEQSKEKTSICKKTWDKHADYLLWKLAARLDLSNDIKRQSCQSSCYMSWIPIKLLRLHRMTCLLHFTSYSWVNAWRPHDVYNFTTCWLPVAGLVLFLNCNKCKLLAMLYIFLPLTVRLTHM